MGVLRRVGSDRLCTLQARHLVGRSPACALQLDGDSSVSGEHATLRWMAGRWEVRDLGSLNGTWIDGRRIPTGEAVALREGGTVRFGAGEERWELWRADPPQVCAMHLDSGETVSADNELLALPSADQPLATVYRSGEGDWVLERDDELRVVQDLDVVQVDTGIWRLHLPDALDGTRGATVDVPILAPLRLRFSVSRDEEHVELVVVHGQREIPLRPRAHLYTVLTLARARLRDAEDESLAPSSHGWVYQTDLERMLGIDRNLLHQYLFRARRQFAAAGIQGAPALFERRPDSGQLRLGVAELEIHTL